MDLQEVLGNLWASHMNHLRASSHELVARFARPTSRSTNSRKLPKPPGPGRNSSWLAGWAIHFLEYVGKPPTSCAELALPLSSAHEVRAHMFSFLVSPLAFALREQKQVARKWNLRARTTWVAFRANQVGLANPSGDSLLISWCSASNRK